MSLVEVFVWFAEEFVDLVIKLVGVLDESAVARVRDDPEVGVGNVLIDQDGVADGDKIVIATDDERRGLNGVELGERDVRLLPIQ